jgi:hypothetical protein
MNKVYLIEIDYDCYHNFVFSKEEDALVFIKDRRYEQYLEYVRSFNQLQPHQNIKQLLKAPEPRLVLDITETSISVRKHPVAFGEWIKLTKENIFPRYHEYEVK